MHSASTVLKKILYRLLKVFWFYNKLIIIVFSGQLRDAARHVI